MNRGLERVMAAHRQELTEIDIKHNEDVKALQVSGSGVCARSILPALRLRAGADAVLIPFFILFPFLPAERRGAEQGEKGRHQGRRR